MSQETPKSQNPLARFDELPVGTPFVFPICLGYLLVHRGVYYKVAPGWYGPKPNQRLFPWMDETPFVQSV